MTTRTRPLALAYVRVSTEEQATGGASVAAQRAELTAEAARRGWDVEVVDDDAGRSAKNLKRPGLFGALARLDRGDADVLLACRVDRVSRSAADFAGLLERAERRGWQLVALDLGVDTSTPSGELMANVMGAFARYERRLIGQRTREGMTQRRDEGVHVGRRRTLPVEVVDRIVTDRAAGATLRTIGDQLTADGIATAHGGTRWHASTVRAVLASVTARQLAVEDQPSTLA